MVWALISLKAVMLLWSTLLITKGSRAIHRSPKQRYQNDLFFGHREESRVEEESRRITLLGAEKFVPRTQPLGIESSSFYKCHLKI